MNKQIQRLGIFLVMCFIAVFAKVQWIQYFDAEKLNTAEGNQRPIIRKYNRPRGRIYTADQVLLAESVDSRNEMVPRKRLYPQGDLFGHVTGYYSTRYLKTGVEATYDAELAGDTLQQSIQGLTSLFSTKENVGNLTLTIRKDVQEVARDNLGARQGAVVALDPRNGEILALWSWPSYDPSLLTAGTDDDAQKAWALLNLNPDKPMLAKSYRDRWNPGSTMKVVTTGVGLESGKVVNGMTSYPVEQSFKPPGASQPIQNFGSPPESCGGSLPLILTVSCNTAFSRMGVDLGEQTMLSGVQSFGFNDAPPIDLPDAVKSVAEPKSIHEPALRAMIAIGQEKVAATPLQMALVAAAAANNGTMMKPHVMHDVWDADGNTVRLYNPEPWRTVLSGDKAQQLYTDMLGPVNDPQGTAAATAKIPGYVVGGKTGTAQTGPPGAPLHAWFMGFAGPPNEPPKVAVAAVVLFLPNANETTGGQVAAPIAREVMKKALEVVDLPKGPPPTATTTPAAPGGPTPPTSAG